MIGRLSGVLAEKNAPWVLLDVNGVGYNLQMPMSSFFNLPILGERVSILTEMIIREDAQLLYGFLTNSERHTFRELIKVSGVGARTALAILSSLNVDELCQAVTSQETTLLTKVPGIGKKTAERLLLELKGRFANISTTTSASAGTEHERGEIIQALVALGYSEKEANSATKILPKNTTVTDGIKLALKSLMR